MQKKIDVHERLPLLQTLPLSLQHLFAMFGSTILVPFLTGLDVSVALFSSGLGTLLYIWVTKGKIPAYLGSSFAFIGPIIIASNLYGVGAAIGGVFAAGLVYLLVGTIISRFGSDWIKKVLPPVVIGSVIIVIGMALAPVAIDMAGLSVTEDKPFDPTVASVAIFTFLVVLLGTRFFKGFLAVIPILIGIVSGYTFAFFLGLVDFTAVKEASWLGLPSFTAPEFNLAAIILIAPVAIVSITEHIGDVFVTGNITGKDFTKDPGLHRSIWGDGLATLTAGLVGGPPNTTYGENIGVMAITRVFSVWVIGGAAIIALTLSFVQKFGALIQTIPVAVMGGVSIVLFGVIASSGIRVLIENKVDFNDKRNLIIASSILVIGIGGASIVIGNFTVQGMALATFVGVILNLVIPAMAQEKEEVAEEA